MKKKQELFDPENTNIAHAIMAETDPKVIKQWGRKVNNFDPRVWDKHKYEVMMTALLLKFSQNDDMGAILLSTGDNDIEEASPFDYIWGTWKNNTGQNLLGKALCYARQENMCRSWLQSSWDWLCSQRPHLPTGNSDYTSRPSELKS